ncbi:MAG TPA: GNAT family N-acetyltransferase [Xanthobacteraceae bacterium]
MTGSPAEPSPALRLRRGRMSDIDTLVALEQAVFTTDVVSRRSFRRFLAAASATLMVAEENGQLVGYALTLYPSHSTRARLYSIAVAPQASGRGLGSLLLAAAEDEARRRGRRAMRLEVHERNRRAIARYKKCGYLLFGKHRDYYDDHGDALRFEKTLAAEPEDGPPVQNDGDRLRHANRV